MGTVRCELALDLRQAIRNCVLIFPKTGVGITWTSWKKRDDIVTADGLDRRGQGGAGAMNKEGESDIGETQGR